MSSSFIIQKGPGIASKAFNYAKKLITGGPKVSPTIKAVNPNVPKNKAEVLKRDLKLATQKRKGSEAKLDNTVFRIEQQKERLLGKQYKKGKELREKKMGGGMMGRRMGYSQGKLAVTPREKQLAAQYGDKKRITRGDVITAAKKKSGERMQAKGGSLPLTKMREVLAKKDPMKDKKPSIKKKGSITGRGPKKPGEIM